MSEQSQPLKNLTEVSNYILQRRKQAAAQAVKDPEDKGNPGVPANPDAAKIEETFPGNGEQTSNTGKKKDMTDENLSKSGEPTAATQNKTVVSEPESPATKAAKAIHGILRKSAGSSLNKDPENKEQAPADKRANNEPNPTMVDMDRNIVFKLASLVRDNEDRIRTIQSWAEQDYGRQQAEQLVKFASVADEEMEKAAYEQLAVEELIKEASEAYNSLPEDEQVQLDKFAMMIPKLTEGMSEDELAAFDLGMKQAAAIADAGGELPAVEEAPSLEEIVMMLEQMVESGEITPEEAEEIMAELQASEMEEGMPEEVKSASERFEKLASAAI